VKQAHRTRREFMKSVAAGIGATALAPLAGLSEASEHSNRHPNVLLVLSDQHRWQSLPFTETPQLQAPHLARLAAEGFRYDRFVSQYPLCSPSRGMLLTGRWPLETGVIDNATRERFALSPSEETLGKAFQKAGYQTAYIGKWHLGGGIRSTSPFGFESSTLWTGTNDHWNSIYYDALGTKRQSRLYNATHMTSQAIAFLEEERDRPFFLTLAWNPPHSNYTDAPTKFSSLYWSPESLPLRSNVEIGPTHSAAEFGDQFRGYHAHISAIDHELGRLLLKLEALKLLDDTLIIYASDHGDALGSHNHIGKRVPYDESLLIPLIVRWPGEVTAGGRTTLPVGIIDFMPTLCSLAGVPVPEQCRGVDYSALALGKSGPKPESQLIMNISNTHPPEGNPFPSDLYRGVRSERYTYTVREDGPWQLFDNEQDVYQTRNLIQAPETVELRTGLHAQLESWLKRAGDSFSLTT
jgi:arylsulfatase A-like enzyme